MNCGRVPTPARMTMVICMAPPIATRQQSGRDSGVTVTLTSPAPSSRSAVLAMRSTSCCCTGTAELYHPDSHRRYPSLVIGGYCNWLLDTDVVERAGRARARGMAGHAESDEHRRRHRDGVGADQR